MEQAGLATTKEKQQQEITKVDHTEPENTRVGQTEPVTAKVKLKTGRGFRDGLLGCERAD